GGIAREDGRGKEARELWEQVEEASSWDGRFARLEAFLARRLGARRDAQRGVAWAWHRLRESAGRAEIADLARALGWSHRRLIAGFRDQVGLAPKRTARILRFDRA